MHKVYTMLECCSTITSTTNVFYNFHFLNDVIRNVHYLAALKRVALMPETYICSIVDYALELCH